VVRSSRFEEIYKQRSWWTLEAMGNMRFEMGTNRPQIGFFERRLGLSPNRFLIPNLG
jgi:hypothetical protein